MNNPQGKTLSPTNYAQVIFDSAQPVIRIHSLSTERWKRGVAKGARIGPWLSADYEIVDHGIWKQRRSCLYLVGGIQDRALRYVGISRNRMADRWRESPAYDAATMTKLPKNQLFHSQCWKHIEREHLAAEAQGYEVRCVDGDAILAITEQYGPPLLALTVHRGDAEGVVSSVERWLCNNRVVRWNVAMTT